MKSSSFRDVERCLRIFYGTVHNTFQHSWRVVRCCFIFPFGFVVEGVSYVGWVGLVSFRIFVACMRSLFLEFIVFWIDVGEHHVDLRVYSVVFRCWWRYLNISIDYLSDSLFFYFNINLFPKIKTIGDSHSCKFDIWFHNYGKIISWVIILKYASLFTLLVVDSDEPHTYT